MAANCQLIRFFACVVLVIVQDSLRCRLVHFKSATGRTRCGELCAHFLDLRRLLPETCGESFDFVLLLPVGRFLPLIGEGEEWAPGKRAFC